MKKTIEQIATELGVTAQLAYGFLNFLKAKKLVSSESAPSNGKRGRRAHLYTVNADAAIELGKVMDTIETLPVQASAQIDVTETQPETVAA